MLDAKIYFVGDSYVCKHPLKFRDIRRGTLYGFREQIISVSFSFFTVPFLLRIFIDDHRKLRVVHLYRPNTRRIVGAIEF